MPSPDRLTKKQRELLGELHALAELFGLDYPNIIEYERDARTPFLEVMKDKLVRAQVVMWYTLVDEYLTNEICRYFFGKKRTFPQLWKTKRFTLFNHYVLARGVVSASKTSSCSTRPQELSVPISNFGHRLIETAQLPLDLKEFVLYVPGQPVWRLGAIRGRGGGWVAARLDSHHEAAASAQAMTARIIAVIESFPEPVILTSLDHC